MKDNKSATFKYNNINDSKIFDSLENKVIDKSQFIKNALYYYIVMIEKGVVVDRNLPQETDVRLADLSHILSLSSQRFIENKEITYENHTEKKEEKDFTIPEELLDVDEDDYDF